MSHSETESTKHAPDPDYGENQANLTSESSKPTENMPMKRKTMEKRSPTWDHFEPIMEGKPNDKKLVGARCLYCDKVLQAGSKKHGTSTLLNHTKSCLKNPHAQETKQTLLSFSKSKDGKNESVLGTWVFNQEVVRDALAKMLIMDELPFSFVESRGFRYFVEKAVPRFQIPSRWTISRDIADIFENGKKELKKELKAHSQSVSLTTDTWTSIQRVNYMVITAHWIDDEWELKKKVISFVPIFSHKGDEIAQVMERCLLEWGLRNIFTVTVDSASSNDVALACLKRKLITWGSSLVKAEYMHMRCIAHILNLVVQDDLKLADTSVRKVRDCVRWMKNSPKRLTTFKKLKGLLGIEYGKSLSLDVPTRWNSTFLMLETAAAYQKVFESYPTEDGSFTNDLGDSVPTCIDWLSVQSLLPILRSFFEMTLRISGSLYVTSNTFMSEISDLNTFIDAMIQNDQDAGKAMGDRMKEKFKKYWGDPEKMNRIIFFSNILDPRDKIAFMPIHFVQLYGEVKGPTLFEKVKSSMAELYDDYVASCPDKSKSMKPPQPPVQRESVSSEMGKTQFKTKRELRKQILAIDGNNRKTELEIYLSEALVEDEEDFDILGWWKLNGHRFPVLSRMARDCLGVPISTVASESTFSTGGRVLDPFRSSLSSKAVEALICAQDWLRGPSDLLQVEENIDDVETFEEQLLQARGRGSTGGSSSTTVPIDIDS